MKKQEISNFKKCYLPYLSNTTIFDWVEKAVDFERSDGYYYDETNKLLVILDVWKSLGKGLLMALECVGYLLYCLFFVWLFVDITDNIKKK